MTTTKRLLVGAIDFGTTFSGWAYSFKHDYDLDPTKANIKHWLSGSGNLMTEKTPTCALVNPDGKTLKAFGYDAENEYRELLDRGDDKMFYFFKRFQMKLYSKIGKGFKRDMTIEDELGRSLLAADVFGMSIKFLVEDMLKHACKGIEGLIESFEIHLVITVPALWSDAAKQFMYEAAEQAGICKEQLTIALEPEATSLYCRHVHINKPGDIGDDSIGTLPNGTKYIVINAGGGTIDLTVHEAGSEHTLREVKPVSGGEWGGTMVNTEFENLLIRLVGRTVFEKFKDEEKEDWLEMQREFEFRKRETNVDSEGKISMRIPTSLTDLYNNHTQLDLRTSLEFSEYAGDIELKRGKMKISNEVFANMFESSVTKIVDYLTSLLFDGLLKEMRVLLMVGGYSESRVLHRAVTEALPGIQVIRPDEASMIVLRGALIYGHNPVLISERILKYTYGTNYTPLFIEGIHPHDKRFKSKDGKIRCRNVFNKFVTTGQTVKPGETQLTDTYFTPSRRQKAMLFEIYASVNENPVNTDDEGCFEIGRLRIEFDKERHTRNRRDRKVTLTMLFGETEIIVEVEDKCTGKKKITTIDFPWK
ncbi:heat shock 70 kDa protein 12B-like [Ruditapes philippinarum]|uniref:heat shock 70 kDa protein 12B-like n=1 Tax=Ruditapes philippinarum TaxID=129788 RepID=UPI00295A57DC|nr:heat shock 70 kDa protein 12B-like [Ruditapes philippinarum]